MVYGTGWQWFKLQVACLSAEHRVEQPYHLIPPALDGAAQPLCLPRYGIELWALAWFIMPWAHQCPARCLWAPWRCLELQPKREAHLWLYKILLQGRCVSQTDRDRNVNSYDNYLRKKSTIIDEFEWHKAKESEDMRCAGRRWKAVARKSQSTCTFHMPWSNK